MARREAHIFRSPERADRIDYALRRGILKLENHLRSSPGAHRGQNLRSGAFDRRQTRRMRPPGQGGGLHSLAGLAVGGLFAYNRRAVAPTRARACAWTTETLPRGRPAT